MWKLLKPMFWLHYLLEMPGCLIEKRSLEYQVSVSYSRIFRIFEECITQVQWQIYIITLQRCTGFQNQKFWNNLLIHESLSFKNQKFWNNLLIHENISFKTKNSEIICQYMITADNFRISFALSRQIQPVSIAANSRFQGFTRCVTNPHSPYLKVNSIFRKALCSTNTHIHTHRQGKLYMPFRHFIVGHKKHEKESKHEKGRVASPESLLIHLHRLIFHFNKMWITCQLH